MPSKEVNELLDYVDTPSIRDNYASELINNEGPTTKEAFERGKQESSMAAIYYSKAKVAQTEWPVTSAIFDALAKSYTSQASIADERADIMDIDY